MQVKWIKCITFRTWILLLIPDMYNDPAYLALNCPRIIPRSSTTTTNHQDEDAHNYHSVEILIYCCQTVPAAMATKLNEMRVNRLHDK